MDAAKVEHSIEAIRLAAKMSRQYYNEPLIITYSGGKDSDVLANLAVKSGADIEFVNSHTTVDAPETVYHIRETFERLRGMGYKTTVIMPETTMWRLIEKKRMPPTRIARYCCSVLKESTTPNRYIATGVRADESRQRGSRSEFEILGSSKKTSRGYTFNHASEVYAEAQEKDEVWDCQFITAAKKKKDLICNPIIKWTERDVWEYIKAEGLQYNPLYDQGYRRVGCIGCPLAGKREREREFADYPQYKQAYIRAFQRMIDKRRKDGLKTDWTTGEQCFAWWTQDETIPGQMTIDDFITRSEE